MIISLKKLGQEILETVFVCKILKELISYKRFLKYIYKNAQIIRKS